MVADHALARSKTSSMAPSATQRPVAEISDAALEMQQRGIRRGCRWCSRRSPIGPDARANCRAPSALVRADTPIRKCPSASQMSPPSTLPGGAIVGSSAKKSRRHCCHALHLALAAGRAGAREHGAPCGHDRRVLDEGRVGILAFGFQRRDVESAVAQRLHVAACCSRARATSGAPFEAARQAGRETSAQAGARWRE